MKVTTVPSPLDSLLGSPPAPPGRSDGSEPSFPETLRGARAERGDVGRASEEEPRPVESSDGGDESESVEESAEGREDASSQSTEDAPIDDAAEATIVDPGTTSMIVSSGLPTGGGSPTEATASPAVVESSPARMPVGPAADAAPPATGTAAADAPRTDGTVTANTTPTDVRNENVATQRESVGSAAPAGASVVEGETTTTQARGATPPTETPTPPLVQRESRPPGVTKAPGEGWFHRSERADAVASDRAAFHLIEGAEAPAENRTAPPVTVPVAGTPGRSAMGAGPESTAEPIAPPLGGATGRVEGTSSAAVASPEVVPADGEPAALARRIYRLVRRTLARGDHELRVRLDPPRLGRVDVDLSVDHEKIGIRFTVDSEEVRETLRSHLSELHRSLDEHGWSAGSVEIDLRQEGADADARETWDRTGSAEHGASEDGSEADLAEIRLWHLGRAVDLRG